MIARLEYQKRSSTNVMTPHVVMWPSMPSLLVNEVMALTRNKKSSMHSTTSLALLA